MTSRILLLEDDGALALDLKRALAPMGCEVVILGDGNGGLARAVSDRFDLVVLSAELKGMNGFRLCNRLKRDAMAGSVPVILTWSESSASALSEHVKLPTRANAYVRKPYSPDDLRGRTLRELALLRNMPYARHGQRFRRPWLASYFSEQSWYHASHFVQSSELSALERQNADAVAHYDVALERADLVRMRDALLQRQTEHHLRPEDNVEAMLLSTRLGERIRGEGITAVDPQVTPLEDPSRLDTLLTLDMLRVLSPRDLRILRNMVRARHGATFHAPSLIDYFEPAEWYHPDPAYNDARLTRVDRQNLRLIQTVEAEIGGPITERQIQEEDMSGA